MIDKNGVSSFNNFNDSTCIFDMETKILSDGSFWVKIFEHNNQSGTVMFTTYDEVMNTQTQYKYSRLYLLDEFRGADGKYEFMLMCPDDNVTAVNRWKQTNNPCDEYVTPTSDGAAFAEGYEAIEICSTGNYWGGLTRQNVSPTDITNSFLSGSVGHTNYFYAVGAVVSYSGGVPISATWPNLTNNRTTKRFQLWVRVDNTRNYKTSIYSNEINSTDFYEI